MPDHALRTAIRAQTQLHALATAFAAYARRTSERMASDERGADVIEYVGMLIFAAIIVLLLLGAASGIGGQILGKVKSEVSNILNNG